MTTESVNYKMSIKDLLFSKAIPNYEIPIPTDGHKVYTCIDCNDRFVFESSYEYHINRKSVKITYMCRHCGQLKIFKNRCNLLCHIRSHAFKTATINVSDLKIEPLPLSEFQIDARELNKYVNLQTTLTSQPDKSRKRSQKAICFECKEILPATQAIHKVRAKHFTQFKNENYSCPVCLLTLHTNCGLKAHLRLHLRIPPYYCPECGIHLSNKAVIYPYAHDCQGFKMMRATTRLKCAITECHVFHPNEYKEHMYNHLKKVYKCPLCVVACFNENTINKHLSNHNTTIRAVTFFQCEMCPGRLVLQNQVDNHLRGHINNYVYPCWVCGEVFKEALMLVNHHKRNHEEIMNINTHASLKIILEETKRKKKQHKTIYRVVKKCDKCLRSFTYTCSYDQIEKLPNECPYKCANPGTSLSSQPLLKDQIKCPLCESRISNDWEDIKKHYAEHHKSHRCLDAKIILKKININKRTAKNKNKLKSVRTKKKISTTNKKKLSLVKKEVSSSSRVMENNFNKLMCPQCDLECQNKDMLESHMPIHRDPCMAYQCMECGKCFVVKRSFSTHLLLEHNITNVEDYINKKQCYNKEALTKKCYDTSSSIDNEPIRENQCKICREQFNNSDDLQKHFRGHGMAFLLKNTSSNKSSTP